MEYDPKLANKFGLNGAIILAWLKKQMEMPELLKVSVKHGSHWILIDSKRLKKDTGLKPGSVNSGVAAILEADLAEGRIIGLPPRKYLRIKK